MQGYQQDMFTICQAYEPAANQRPGLQIECCGGFLNCQPLRFSICPTVLTQVIFLQAKATVFCCNMLKRLAVHRFEST